MRLVSGWWAAPLLLLVVLSGSAAPAPQLRSPAEYRNHLAALSALVAACGQKLDAASCSADAVGPDDKVALPGRAETRPVSYDWLRSMLQSIAGRKLKTADAKRQLGDAARRIDLDLAEAPGGSVRRQFPTPPSAAATLEGILRRPEFRQQPPSLLQRALDRLSLWINGMLFGLVRYGENRRWLGFLLEVALLLVAGAALVFWFVRQTRRARGLALSVAAPLDQPALRSWERLRQDAEEAARAGRWRDAVRAYYWAAISRFESRGQWSTDRARTPREYLRLLPPEDPRREDLRRLTGRFETCWYGATAAGEPDSEAARQLCDRLAAR